MPNPPPAAGSLEAENELRQFLRNARPEWSKPRRCGRTDITRVVTKLRTIGVTDVDTLVRRTYNNTINDDLFASGFVRFSREAIDAIKAQRPFMQALEGTDVPLVRQVDSFAPVAQMLSRRRLASAQGGTRSLPSLGSARCSTAPLPGSPPRSRSSAHGGRGGHDMAATFSEGFAPSTGRAGDAGGRPSLDSSTLARRVPRLRGTRTDGRKERRQLSGDFDAHSLHVLFPTEEYDGGDGGFSDCPELRMPAQRAVGGGGGETPDSQMSAAARSKGILRGPGVARTDETRPATEQEMLSPSGSTSTLRKARTTTLDSVDAGSGPVSPVKARGRAATAGSAHELPTVEEVTKLHLESQAVLRLAHERGGARWTCSSFKNPMQQGEEMLREQAALDDRKRLRRMVRGMTDDTPFRAHVASNIKHRLKEEARRDAVDALATQQQCINIRKHLASMLNSRRELVGLRSRVQSLVEDEEPEPQFPLSDLGFGFKPAKKDTSTVVESPSESEQQRQEGRAGDQAGTSDRLGQTRTRRLRTGS